MKKLKNKITIGDVLYYGRDLTKLNEFHVTEIVGDDKSINFYSGKGREGYRVSFNLQSGKLLHEDHSYSRGFADSGLLVSTNKKDLEKIIAIQIVKKMKEKIEANRLETLNCWDKIREANKFLFN